MLGLISAPAAAGESTKTFEITIKNGRVVGEKSARVSKGDTVILRWSSDKALRLHLHGYGIEIAVTPAAPAEMKFLARATGRYPVEIHTESEPARGRGHTPIFHLDVYPD